MPRYIKIGKYQALLIYKGQPVINPWAKCNKCLQTGHKQDSCQNDWKCKSCGKSGHKAKDCMEGETDGSGTETSGDETDCDDHVDQSDVPPSQSILQPTEAGKPSAPLPGKEINVVGPETHNKNTEQPMNKNEKVSETPKKKKKSKKDKKDKTEQKGSLYEYFNNNFGTDTPQQKSGNKRSATTPTDELHRRETTGNKTQTNPNT